jgi:hypothetical protein
MAEGDITWFRYARHDGIEREVRPKDTHLPQHHGHYSYLQEIDRPMNECVLPIADMVEPQIGERRLINGVENAWMGKRLGWHHVRVASPIDPRDSVKAILAERAKTHGSFGDNARYSQGFKAIARSSPHWGEMSEVMREALEAKFLKLSRILSGNFAEADHWKDDAGYSQLVVESLEKEAGSK